METLKRILSIWTKVSFLLIIIIGLVGLSMSLLGYGDMEVPVWIIYLIIASFSGTITGPLWIFLEFSEQ